MKFPGNKVHQSATAGVKRSISVRTGKDEIDSRGQRAFVKQISIRDSIMRLQFYLLAFFDCLYLPHKYI